MVLRTLNGDGTSQWFLPNCTVNHLEMHILLTNDDGPLDNKACPYIKYLVDEINLNTDWDLSIVVPNQQRSWIGKAHFAGKTLSTTYIYTETSTLEKNDRINAFEGPFNTPQEAFSGPQYQEWCLVDSTPAACADLGIHHLNRKQSPIDLVVSGPNFGKNSSNLYILASGTVGAAMEAVTHGMKAIALSYEYVNLDHDYATLREAAKVSVKLIEKLYPQLKASQDIDLYSINVPLIESLKLGQTKAHFAPILINQWNSIYAPTEDKCDGQQQFKWNPDFAKVHRDGLKDLAHTDNRVLVNEGISVTPLKAAFHVVAPHSGEIDLVGDEAFKTGDDTEKVFLISLPRDSYLYNPLVEAFKKAGGFTISNDATILQKISQNPNLRVFHYADYEDLDIDLIQLHPDQYFIPSYIYRKALIRKHFLANTIHHYTVKNPTLVLSAATPLTFQLEVDYAEFLDDALDDAYELRQEIENTSQTWILKPSMSDKGQGIRIFNNVAQLQEIFNSFEEGEDDDDDESEDNNGVIISQLRHFIVQKYQANPLLLLQYDNKKFHLRVYVVAQGDLKVFVYRNILTLFADSTFVKPVNDGDDTNDEILSLAGHLTNTCLQEDANPLVVPFWDLEGLDMDKKERVFAQVALVSGELFKAAAAVDKINFQPLQNAVEIFGVDFLVNDDYSVQLLEVNSYPDFKQTGGELKGLIDQLFAEVATELVVPVMAGKEPSVARKGLLETVLE